MVKVPLLKKMKPDQEDESVEEEVSLEEDQDEE